jgi:threonine/homoserine/homoserine lactone efflux protein
MDWTLVGPVDPAVIPGFLAAMVLIELTPGPNMAYLAALSADRGRVAGLAAVCGVAAGLAVYLVAAIAGVTELLLLWPAAYDLLRWAGVAFLLWLAWDAWRGADSEAAPADTAGPGQLALAGRGFIANILNPKAAMFYVMILPGFIRPGFGPPAAQSAVFGAGHILISTAIHGAIVLGAARAGAVVASGGRMVLVRRGLALGLAVIALWLAWETRRP